MQILWRSGLGLLMGKFHQFLTELSARNMIMAGYYGLMLLLVIQFCIWFYCVVLLTGFVIPFYFHVIFFSLFQNDIFIMVKN